MKKVFEAEGIFIEYEERPYKDGLGNVIPNKVERPTKLWWLLKEAIKGKNVRVVVYEGGRD